MSDKHGSPYSAGESCRICKCPAVHKVGEQDARPDVHEYTTYLCCSHFSSIMGRVAERECKANQGSQDVR